MGTTSSKTVHEPPPATGPFGAGCLGGKVHGGSGRLGWQLPLLHRPKLLYFGQFSLYLEASHGALWLGGSGFRRVGCPDLSGQSPEAPNSGARASSGQEKPMEAEILKEAMKQTIAFDQFPNRTPLTSPESRGAGRLLHREAG